MISDLSRPKVVDFRLAGSFCGMAATGRPETRFTVDEGAWLLVVVMEEVRGGGGGLDLPPGALFVWAAETVVTLDVTEDASLPDEPGAFNSSSNEVRDAAGGLDARPGEVGERSVFIPGEVADWRRGRESDRGVSREEEEWRMRVVSGYVEENKERAMIRVYRSSWSVRVQE